MKFSKLNDPLKSIITRQRETYSKNLFQGATYFIFYVKTATTPLPEKSHPL